MEYNIFNFLLHYQCAFQYVYNMPYSQKGANIKGSKKEKCEITSRILRQSPDFWEDYIVYKCICKKTINDTDFDVEIDNRLVIASLFVWLFSPR